MLTDLADVCRTTGLKVVEEDGWKRRGRPGGMGDVRTITCHHTAGPKRGDAPSLNVVKFGRQGTNPLPGPLAQILLSRSGVVHVIAAGRCNHAGESISPDYENEHAIGIEAEATGGLEWDGAPIETYALLAGVLAHHYGAQILGHKETCEPIGRKQDPGLSMPRLRSLAKDALMPLNGHDLALITDTPISRNLNGKTPKTKTVSLAEFIESTDQKIDDDRKAAAERHAELLAAIAALSPKK